jgi:hypothetical protein
MPGKSLRSELPNDARTWTLRLAESTFELI